MSKGEIHGHQWSCGLEQGDGGFCSQKLPGLSQVVGELSHVKYLLPPVPVKVLLMVSFIPSWVMTKLGSFEQPLPSPCGSRA